jgi:predicted Zn-dependent peptidase
MDFEVIESKRLKERVLYTKHPTGLDIFIVPKAGYSSQYAIFGTKYGSIDNRFNSVQGEVNVPEGIAHFLEHKLFESEDGDAFTRFAKTGASANAYTSFDRTCYLFSCTSNFKESLEILLDFVQSPYFTEKTVQKEQGIIGQEITMYEDDPGWRVMFNLLKLLYKTHPVRIDIAGTTESISKITADLLYKCYNAFYNLNNMVLCVAGDVDPAVVLEVADKILKPAPALEVTSSFEPEPVGIVAARFEQKLSISVPLFNMGFKGIPSNGRDDAKSEAVTDILLEIIGGDSSPLYRRLYDAGIINASFGMQYFSGRSFAATIIGGESREPDRVADEFFKEIETLKAKGIAKADFERAKKTIYGRLAAQYDSIKDVTNAVAGCRFADMGPFDMIDAVAETTIDEVTQKLSKHFTKDNYALSIILPLK